MTLLPEVLPPDVAVLGTMFSGQPVGVGGGTFSSATYPRILLFMEQSPKMQKYLLSTSWGEALLWSLKEKRLHVLRKLGRNPKQRVTLSGSREPSQCLPLQ